MPRAKSESTGKSPAKKSPAKKVAAKKPAAKKTVAKKAVAKKAAPKKAAAKKAPAKKATVKKPVAKVAATKAPAKKAVKAPVKKATASKAVATKAPAKKSVVKPGFRARRTQAPSAGKAITAGKKAPASLAEYQRMRDFGTTPEPSGTERPPNVGSPMFCVQRHAATALHYDVRLEMGGVLKSWACPKGPSYDPTVKRLAMETEDHPLSYGDFEGLIPEGHYGAGAVMLWDIGTIEFMPEKGVSDPFEQYAKGKMVVYFHGTKLNGEWAFVKTNFGGKDNAWLLIKHRDATARDGYDVIQDRPESVKTRRSMEEIAKGGGEQTRKRVERDKGK